MSKINMVAKVKGFGQQYVMFDPNIHEVLGTNDTDGVKDLVEQKLHEGHSILHMGDQENFIIYCSKKTDGFTREVTEENWKRNMQLNVYEKEQHIWEANVNKWFEIMFASEDCKAELNSIARPAFALPPYDLEAEVEAARVWLSTQSITKSGSSGKRRQSPWEFLAGNGKDRFKKPSAWIKRSVANHVFKRTPKEYKKKQQGSW